MHDRFNIVKKGYDPVSVDSYVDYMESALKNYTEKETMISQAILSAQASASRIVEDAKKTADDMVRDAHRDTDDAVINAKRDAEIIVSNAQKQAEEITTSAKADARVTKKAYEKDFLNMLRFLDSQRKLLQNFQHEYNSIVTRYLNPIGSDDLSSAYSKISEMETNLRQFMSDD